MGAANEGGIQYPVAGRRCRSYSAVPDSACTSRSDGRLCKVDRTYSINSIGSELGVGQRGTRWMDYSTIVHAKYLTSHLV